MCFFFSSPLCAMSAFYYALQLWSHVCKIYIQTTPNHRIIVEKYFSSLSVGTARYPGVQLRHTNIAAKYKNDNNKNNKIYYIA